MAILVLITRSVGAANYYTYQARGMRPIESTFSWENNLRSEREINKDSSALCLRVWGNCGLFFVLSCFTARQKHQKIELTGGRRGVGRESNGLPQHVCCLPLLRHTGLGRGLDGGS